MKRYIKLVSLALLVISVAGASTKAFSIAAVVDAPQTNFLLNLLTNQSVVNTTKTTGELFKIFQSLETLKTQTELTKRMAEDVRNGDITPSMLEFAADLGTRCGYKAPKIVLKDFPDLDLFKNICKNGGLDLPSIEAKFSFKDGMSLEEKKQVIKNIDTLKEDSYSYSLGLGLSSRVVDVHEDIKNLTKQLNNKTLFEQIYTSNEIQLMMVTQLVEIRRLLGAILENSTLDKADSYKHAKAD